MRTALVIWLLLTGSAFALPFQEAADESADLGPWATEANPDLPNVLILGDSISIGYTRQVKTLLDGKANVFRPNKNRGKNPENCAGTTRGLTEIDRWIGDRRWDVIHFNWGLHDLKHVDPDSGKNSNSFDDPHQADPDAYRENLTKLVGKLKATNAKLIFATTTAFPDGTKPARASDDAARYNTLALEIMKANEIRINDLYELTEDRLDELQQPRNVHFKPAGNEVLAKQVADSITAALEKNIE